MANGAITFSCEKIAMRQQCALPPYFKTNMLVWYMLNRTLAPALCAVCARHEIVGSMCMLGVEIDGLGAFYIVINTSWVATTFLPVLPLFKL